MLQVVLLALPLLMLPEITLLSADSSDIPQ
jgi:hypothetical protein